MNGFPGGPVPSAVLIGACFGFVLERAGLGSSRKLTGQFYGTDQTVLQVMMTAIVTAMLGLFWASRFGVIDPASLQALPTHLLPQTLGGLVFGAGFVTGGYCPGTSCVAAASGKMDALVLIGGMLLGVFLFDEIFPLISPLYDATPLGTLTLPAAFGIAPSVFIFTLTAASVAVFVLLGRISRRKTAGGASAS